MPLTFLLRPEGTLRHAADVARIGAALNAAGYVASAADAGWAWQQYSGVECGEAWVSPHASDAEIVTAVRKYLVEAK